MQKSVVFLYTKNKQHEKEMKKNNPIYNNIKRTNHLGINVTQYVKELHIENLKTLMKKSEDTNKWKDILCS